MAVRGNNKDGQFEPTQTEALAHLFGEGRERSAASSLVSFLLGEYSYEIGPLETTLCAKTQEVGHRLHISPTFTCTRTFLLSHYYLFVVAAHRDGTDESTRDNTLRQPQEVLGIPTAYYTFLVPIISLCACFLDFCHRRTAE